MTNNKIISLNTQGVPIARKRSSNIIKYDTFTTLSSGKALWTPESGKSVFLTAVQVSAPQAVSIILSEDNNDFLTLTISEQQRSLAKRFPSPYKLLPDHSLMVRTANEEIKCATSGAVNASQVAYNGRTDFSNFNNATGLHNGTFATLNSGLLITGGNILLGYNLLPVGFANLEIQSVVINFYCRLTITLEVGISTMIYSWRPNPQASLIQLGQESRSLLGSINHLTTPISFDITNAVLGAADPWDVIANLQTSFIGSHTGIGLGNTIDLDAVEIEVCTLGQNKITVFGYEL